MSRRRHGTSLTKADYERMRELRSQGWSYPRIAIEFNCDHTTVMRHTDGNGVKKERLSKHGFRPLQHDSLGRPIGRSYAELHKDQYGVKPGREWFYSKD